MEAQRGGGWADGDNLTCIMLPISQSVGRLLIRPVRACQCRQGPDKARLQYLVRTLSLMPGGADAQGRLWRSA